MRIKIWITGDPNDQMAITISHDLTQANDYDYGACALADVPVVVGDALKEVIAEIKQLLDLEPHERTQAKAHEIWLEGQKGE